MAFRTFLAGLLMPGCLAAQHAFNGSGTSRLPDATPMQALHGNAAGWDLMGHGGLWLRYTRQNANHPDLRGDQAVDAPNWIMLMAGRDLGADGLRLDLRAMLSADRLTEGGDGYPLLFATGETWKGEPLYDRQHPHDLFMELAALFSRPLSGGSRIFLYLGMPGEPALGPTAYMHRPANKTNPDAVLGHHNQDATHISFGVATAGWMDERFKVDASVFTGREPDEERYGFDRPRFDSYSLRLGWEPASTLAAQVSAGYLQSPETLEPGEDKVRITASLLQVLPFSGGRFLSTGLVYGGNFPEAGGSASSLALESEWDWNLGTWYARAEAVEKPGHDLASAENLEERLFWTHGLTLGGSVRLLRRRHLQASLGGQATANLPVRELEPYYGEFPLSFQVFLHLSPDFVIPDERRDKPDPAIRGRDDGDHHGH